MRWRSLFPLLEQVENYTTSRLRLDIIAGLTVCIMLIPQGMAYAMLAGVPPIYGLYTALLPLLVYGLMGTSRQLSLGPVAVSSLLILAGISQVAEPGSSEYITLVILSGVCIGVAQLLMGVLRLGALANLLSNPVIMGFSSAAAIIIAISQLPDLFGIDVPRFPHLHLTVSYIIEYLGQTHWLTFAFCSGTILLLLALKRWAPKLPGALLVVILGTVFTYFLDLNAQGLQIIGSIPAGLPDFQFPEFSLTNLQLIWPTVLTVTIMGVVETISIAKALEMQNKDTEVRPNQELIAIGVSKVFGAFFQAIPSSASFTRSAINNEAGATSGVASMVAAIATALALLVLTPLFYYLPEAVLAGIILMAVRSLLNVRGVMSLWRIDRRDFFMALITFLATLGLGIAEGVLTGVVLSILSILYQASRPHIAVLGQLPNSSQFRNIARYPNVRQFDGILVVRFDAPLYFLNAAYFKEQLKKLMRRYPAELHTLVLDTSSIISIDSSGLMAIRDMLQHCADQNVRLYLAGTMGPVRDVLSRSGIDQEIGQDCHFLHNIDAVEFVLND